MNGRIEPNINAYGTYARVEALADWLEVAALVNRRVTSTQLEDMIADNLWTRLSSRQFLLPEDKEDDTTPETWVDAVHQTLLRRQDILGDRWPYRFSGTWRIAAAHHDPYVPYNALLAMTVAHGWGIETPTAPEALLEGTVVRALTAQGIRAAALGTARGEGGFVQNGLAAAAELGLTFIPDAAPVHVRAKDEGVDTIALVGWPSDNRPAGQWLFLGQATVARSNNWYKKLMEPRPDHWSARLNQPLHGLRFLAVPHHVASDYLSHLVGAVTGMVIDRLRLTMSLVDVSPSEREVLEAVITAGVWDGRAAA
jgi:hypothetical protein